MKLACELPDRVDRSLSLWTCAELARTLRRDGIVEDISPQTVQRVLSCHRLKPWRVHHWLGQKGPRDEAFRARVQVVCELYTRDLGPDERAYSVDEKTSIQPRTRTQANRPALPNGTPQRVEHEYQRKGALNLFAAFDLSTGKVTGILRPRKRQAEFIELLERLDAANPDSVRTIHIVCDNVSTHHGKQVRAWLERHPRFVMHFTPVHCSWMNQVEQWFSILQRKRLTVPNFKDLADLEERLQAFIREWNAEAAPFRWKRCSFDKVLAKADAAIQEAA